MLVDAVTHLDTYPAALKDPGKRAEIATALASLQAELETRGKLREDVELQVDESGRVLIPGIGPNDVFDALTIASPDWGDHGLFVPRGADE